MNESLIKENFDTKMPETVEEDREEFQSFHSDMSSRDPSPLYESSPGGAQPPSGMAWQTD